MLTASQRRGGVWACVGIGAVVGVVKVALTLPVLTRYGWDRDELYFLAAAHHPALGYVDFPPVTAWIGWVVYHLAGSSLAVLRLTTQLASVVGVVLVALMVREFGGGRWTQAAGAAAWAVTPFALGAGSIFHPTFFDATVWIALAYLAVRILGRPEPRLWWVFGVVAGVGLETKYTVVAFLLGLLVGLLVTPQRRQLRTRGPWIAIGVAALVFAPNLAWEATHSWVSVSFFPSQEAQTAADTPVGTYIAEVIGFAGAMLPVIVVGLVAMWRRPALRPIAVAWIFVTTLFLVERGRGYYPVPADSVAIAAGITVLGSWLDRPRRWWAVAALVLANAMVLALVSPLVIPVRTTAGMIQHGDWKNSFFKDEIGWPGMADQTAQAWRQLPPKKRRNAVVLAENYGEAGALALYGPARGLPEPLSGHLSWQYWRPGSLPQRWALTVGFERGAVGDLCSSFRVVAHIRIPYRLGNEELGRPIALCHLRAPLGTVWQSQIARSHAVI